MAPSLNPSDPGAPLLVLGASGPVGTFLLHRLQSEQVMIMAVSRRQPERGAAQAIWLQQDLNEGAADVEANVLVSLGPMRHALAQVAAGHRLGRVIALSSASTYFKSRSSDPAERSLMTDLIDLEQELTEVCRQREIDLTLLKPTMIYGSGRDQNIARIGGLISRLRLVPYCGRGMRQPVHADDLAALIVNCLKFGRQANGTFAVGGGESLEYPAMLRRVASAGGQTVQLLRLPVWTMTAMLRLAHTAGRLEDIRPAMLKRQAMDLVVDDQTARDRLGWRPRPFRP